MTCMQHSGGKEVTEENCYEFEGAQGICPEGWHIPTRPEFVGLCGLSNKAVGRNRQHDQK